MSFRGYAGRVTALCLAGTSILVGPGAGTSVAATATCPVFTAVAGGSGHSLGLASDGTVWAWGGNSDGELGDGTTTPRAQAAPVPGLTGVTAVAAGHGYSLALAGGAVYYWGGGLYEPTGVSGLGSGVTAIAAGLHHSMALVGGSIKAWGDNTSGQIGDGTTTNRPTPVTVTGITGATAIAAGGFHSLAVAGGGAKAWGQGGNGALGNGAWTNSSTPVSVSGLGAGVTDVAAGYTHSLALAGGAVRAWGDNSSGQLGNGTTSGSNTPVSSSGLGSGVTAIASKSAHSLALVNGGLVAWGNNFDGELGNGTTTTSTVPVAVSGLGSGVTAFAAGSSHSLAVVGGSVRAWGDNASGQLGDGTTTDRPTPVTVNCVAVPAALAVTDTPDPVAAGNPVTFAASWSDADPTARGRLVVCKSDAVSVSSCPGGAWAIGDLSAPGTATAVYQTAEADLGERAYHAFVCDSAHVCSPPTAGTFTVVESGPSIVSVQDAPDPAFAGDEVTFTVGWTDPNPNDPVEVAICRTDVRWCPTDAWARSALTYDNVVTMTYRTGPADVGTHDYYAVACDWAGDCADPVPGTFTVAPSPSASPPPASSVPSQDCTTKLSEGRVGAVFSRVSYAQPDPQTVWLCVRVDDGSSVTTGGKFVVTAPGAGSGGVPDVDGDSSACTTTPGNLVPGPHPLPPAEIGDASDPSTHVVVQLDTYVSAGAAWLCLDTTTPAGADHRRIKLPVPIVSIPAATFLPDSPGTARSSPAVAPGPESGLCQTSSGTGHAEYLNVQTAAGALWLTSWRESPSRLHVCVREQGMVSAGGRLTIDTGSSDISPTVMPGSDLAACDVNIASLGTVVGIRRSSGTSPATICAQVNGTPTTLTVGTSGSAVPPSVTWTPDP